MDEKLFRTLLYQSEGTELDFKRDQYAFKGADDLGKSKLLKDILTFANSWRLGSAHILIGVEELSDGRCDPHGISPADHIDDTYRNKFLEVLKFPSVDKYWVRVEAAREALLQQIEILTALLKTRRSELSKQHGVPVEVTKEVQVIYRNSLF